MLLNVGEVFMSKVSIVVCVYNAEKTLDTCIKSIISQNFKDFDLIIVNDGSKDRSLDIINNYMVKEVVMDLEHLCPSLRLCSSFQQVQLICLRESFDCI